MRVEIRCLKATVNALIAENNQTREKSNKYIEECSDIVYEAEAHRDLVEQNIRVAKFADYCAGYSAGLAKIRAGGQKRLTSATVNELPAAAAAQKDDVPHEQVDKKQCQGVGQVSCVSQGDKSLWAGVDEKCLGKPQDKNSKCTKWPKNYTEIKLLERVTAKKPDITLLRKKNDTQCPTDQTYLKSTSRGVNVKKVNKILPAGGPTSPTNVLLCPNCFQRRFEQWVTM